MLKDAATHALRAPKACLRTSGWNPIASLVTLRKSWSTVWLGFILARLVSATTHSEEGRFVVNGHAFCGGRGKKAREACSKTQIEPSTGETCARGTRPHRMTSSREDTRNPYLSSTSIHRLAYPPNSGPQAVAKAFMHSATAARSGVPDVFSSDSACITTLCAGTRSSSSSPRFP